MYVLIVYYLHLMMCLLIALEKFIILGYFAFTYPGDGEQMEGGRFWTGRPRELTRKTNTINKRAELVRYKL